MKFLLNNLKFIILSACCILLMGSTTQAEEQLSAIDMTNLQAAIDVAAKGIAAGQAPFGAVVAGPDGVILMRQGNLVIRNHDHTLHAESVLASHFCSKYFDNPELIKNSTLYTSAEPCAMCMFTIFSAGIGRVVYSLSEEKLYNLFDQYGHWPRMTLTSRQSAVFMSDPIKVSGPFLEKEGADLIRRFFKQLNAPKITQKH